MFSYVGMTEKELTDLCVDKNLNKGNAEWKYWTSEIYSFGKYLRLYGFYPSWLPLYVYMEHGVAINKVEEIPPHELNNDAYCHFYMDARKIPYFKEKSTKPCYPLKSLSVYCRKRNNYKQSPEAKGSLFFFSHSTPDIENEMNLKELFQELKTLPEQMQPVCVCLHMHDINKGVHKQFIGNGFPVYTAGNTLDNRFADRFYSLIKNFKYTFSNEIGSYTFYSVEMGIPFFFYGSEPVYYNVSDENIPSGRYTINQQDFYREMVRLFSYSGFNVELTEEQVQFTKMKLGLETGLSRLQMSKILWKAYFSNESAIRLLKRTVHYFVRVLLKRG